MQDQMLREVEQLIPTLRRYARFLLRDAHAADDLVQDCLERAVRYLDRFERGTNLRAWLLSIMRNCFLDGKRRSKRRSEVALDQLPEATMCSPARQEHNLLLRELAAAFVELPAEQKLAMICVVFEGQSYEEAAATLGVAVGTVKSRVARGREALRQATEIPHAA
jgi:RNA polymerase sigma-70 factor (ECF subfamily)